MFTLETEFKYENVQFLIGIGEVYRLNALILHTGIVKRNTPFFRRFLLKITVSMGFS